MFRPRAFLQALPPFPERNDMFPSGICKGMKIVIGVVQIHYNSHTVFNRYPEWVAVKDSIQFDNLRTYCLFVGKSGISGIVGTWGIGTGDYRTDTY